MRPTAVTADLLAGLLAGLAVALPIGPIGTYLFGLGARQRFAIAAAAALGVATTDGVYAVVAGLGVGGAEQAIGALASPLRWLAAALLIGLAGRTMVLTLRGEPSRPDQSRPDQSRPDQSRPGQSRPDLDTTTANRSRAGSPLRTYALLVGLTTVNPATIATFAAVVVGHRLSGSPLWLAALVFGLGAFAASSAWQLLLVGGGSMLGRALSGRRGQLAVSSMSAGVMLVLAVSMLRG